MTRSYVLEAVNTPTTLCTNLHHGATRAPEPVRGTAQAHRPRPVGGLPPRGTVRVDLVRGLAIVFVVRNHVNNPSPFQLVT